MLRQALVLHGGFDVVGEAEDGRGAIAACRELQPDVIVLDLGLPDLAGRDVLTGIRAGCSGVRIVVYSGTHTLASAEILEPVEAFVEKRHDVAYLVRLLAGMGSGAELSTTVALPGSLADVASARRLADERCHAWGCGFLADDAALVVSELVSNAVVHAQTGCLLTLRYRSSVLRVEVEDRGAGMPDIRTATEGDVHGRGLLLVGALSTAWGAEPAAQRGKRVWAELAPGRQDVDEAADIWRTGLHAG